MPHRATGQDYTVLDFILNGPNPVEPTTAPPKHPLHSSAQLNAGYPHDLRRLLLESGPRESSGESSIKRRKTTNESNDGNGSGGDTARDLPRLPARPGSSIRVRRARLPPTLSGLHQPPPNAGLLPSISVEQPKETSTTAVSAGASSDLRDVEKYRPTDTASAAGASSAQGNAKAGKPRRNKWSDEETTCLLKGVAKFGIGSWTKILKCDEYQFERRTALDLKDRFRVCCPDQYKKPKPQSLEDGPQNTEATSPGPSISKSRGRDRKNASELVSLGIEEPFQRSSRRSRHAWTSEEDLALWTGFNKHGKSWASIQHDEDLRLSHRTPTDLRDRLRQRYPDAYAGTGLAPRPEVFPAPPDRARKDQTSEAIQAGSTEMTNSFEPAQCMPSDPRDADRLRNGTATGKPAHTAPLFLPNDVFFGMPADDEEFDPEPIVLDRGILDWALDSTKPGQQGTSHDSFDSGSQSREQLPNTATSCSVAGNNSSGSLPSLATITAANDDYTDLELPSLMQYLEADRRGGGHGFLSLEDLLQS